MLLDFLPSLLIQVPCIQNNQLDVIMSFWGHYMLGVDDSLLFSIVLQLFFFH
jgi:hypothetical protein